MATVPEDVRACKPNKIQLGKVVTNGPLKGDGIDDWLHWRWVCGGVSGVSCNMRQFYSMCNLLPVVVFAMQTTIAAVCPPFPPHPPPTNHTKVLPTKAPTSFLQWEWERSTHRTMVRWGRPQ